MPNNIEVEHSSRMQKERLTSSLEIIRGAISAQSTLKLDLEAVRENEGLATLGEGVRHGP